MNKCHLKNTNLGCSITSLGNLSPNSTVFVGKLFLTKFSCKCLLQRHTWALAYWDRFPPWCSPHGVFSLSKMDLLPALVSGTLKFISLLSLGRVPTSLHFPICQECSLHGFQFEFTFFDPYCRRGFISALDYRMINSFTLIEVSSLKSYNLSVQQLQ